MPHWSGLGQPLATASSSTFQLTRPPTDPGYVSQRVIGGEMRVYPYGVAILFDDGSAYYEDSTKYWETWEPDGFKCWGDGISGGWKCEDGSSGGTWYTEPKVSAIKQKAQTAKTSAPPPATTTTPPPATTTTPAPQGQATITQLPDGSQQYAYPDGSKEIYNQDGTYTNIAADGSWNTIDATGFKCSGDAQGNYLCDDGTCAGSWCTSPPISGDNTMIWIIGGAVLVLAVLLGGRRR